MTQVKNFRNSNIGYLKILYDSFLFYISWCFIILLMLQFSVIPFLGVGIPSLLALCHKVVAGILKTSDALVKDIRCSLRFSIALFSNIEFTLKY